jgi:hypothetical protein
MKSDDPVAISSLREITGHVRPMELANAIRACFPSSWGGAFFITLNNIRDCIAAEDRWFEEQTTDGFRIFTDSGFSGFVRNRLAACSGRGVAIELVAALKGEFENDTDTPPRGGDDE